jgi:hypothetical protein
MGIVFIGYAYRTLTQICLFLKNSIFLRCNSLKRKTFENFFLKGLKQTFYNKLDKFFTILKIVSTPLEKILEHETNVISVILTTV